MPFCPSRAFSPPTSFWHFWSPLLFHTSAFFHLRTHSSFSEPLAQLYAPSYNLFYSLFLWFCIGQQHFLPFLSLGQVRQPDPVTLLCIFSHDSSMLFITKIKFHLAHLDFCRGNQCDGIKKEHCSIHRQHSIIFQQPGPSGTYLTESCNLSLN